MENRNTSSLAIAIVFAAVAISGSLVYFGMQVSGQSGSNMDNDSITQAVEKGLENYVTKMQDQQQQQVQANNQNAADMAKNVPPVTAEDHIYGNADAEISLVEYSDFRCPFCARFHTTAKQIVDESNGKVNWVYRHYPLPSHDPAATSIANASECIAEIAGNDKFWEFTNDVFDRFSTPDSITTDEGVLALAKELGISESELSTCMESEKYVDKIVEQRNDGGNAGVTGTPGTIVLNNSTKETVPVKGAQPIEKVREAIDQL